MENFHSWSMYDVIIGVVAGIVLLTIRQTVPKLDQVGLDLNDGAFGPLKDVYVCNLSQAYSL
jgi:hypothetical protein